MKKIRFILLLFVIWVMWCTPSVFAENCNKAQQLVDSTLKVPPMTGTDERFQAALKLCPNTPDFYLSIGDYYHHWSKNDISPEKRAFYSYLATEYYANGIKSGKGDVVKTMKFKLADIESGTEDITEVGIRSIKPFARVNIRVFFKFNSSQLSQGAQKQLDVLGKYLTEKNASRIILEGHTDMVGSETYNLWLSQQRAINAKQYLINKFGVPLQAIETKGYGFDRLADAADPYSSKNRRVRVRKLAN